MKRLLCCLTLALLLAAPALGGELRLRTAVEKDRVAVGEPFVWQLRVEGTLEPEVPPLEEIRRQLPDFDVVFLGVQPQNSSSTIIFNGRKTVRESRSANIQYQLSARREGALRIPAVAIVAEGQKLVSQPRIVRAAAAPANPNFILQAPMTRDVYYVGETFPLSVVFYFRENLSSVSFNLPLAAAPGFAAALPRTPQGTGDEVPVFVNGERAIARQGRKRLGGREFATLSFTVEARTEKAGRFAIAAPTVSGLYGGDGFFSRGERFFAAGAAREITVRELPAAGRPANFSGLIGRFQLAATVEPAEAAVGDPLTLTVLVTGEGGLDAVELPDLGKQPEFVRDFRVPAERADGRRVDAAKAFTQTLRALRDDVRAVPPVRLDFFNPESGKYETAASAPCALKIHAAQAVGAEALEGLGAAPAAGRELESERAGMAPNHVGAECLRPALPPSTVFRGWQWAALAAMPLAYLALWAALRWRERRSQTAGRRRAHGALGRFRREVARLQREGGAEGGAAGLLTALREYCAGRFALSAGSLTFADVAPLLPPDLAPAARERLRALFARAEAACYAAPQSAGGAAPLSEAEAAAALAAVEAVD